MTLVSFSLSFSLSPFLREGRGWLAAPGNESFFFVYFPVILNSSREGASNPSTFTPITSAFSLFLSLNFPHLLILSASSSSSLIGSRKGGVFEGFVFGYGIVGFWRCWIRWCNGNCQKKYQATQVYWPLILPDFWSILFFWFWGSICGYPQLNGSVLLTCLCFTAIWCFQCVSGISQRVCWCVGFACFGTYHGILWRYLYQLLKLMIFGDLAFNISIRMHLSCILVVDLTVMFFAVR